LRCGVLLAGLTVLGGCHWLFPFTSAPPAADHGPHEHLAGDHSAGDRPAADRRVELGPDLTSSCRSPASSLRFTIDGEHRRADLPLGEPAAHRRVEICADPGCANLIAVGSAAGGRARAACRPAEPAPARIAFWRARFVSGGSQGAPAGPGCSRALRVKRSPATSHKTAWGSFADLEGDGKTER